MKKSLLCMLRFHKWSKPKSFNIFSSNVIDYSKYCLKCNKKKVWNKPKEIDKD